MTTTRIPSSWQRRQIQDLYEVVGGGTPSTAVPEYWEGGIPWITSADIHGVKDIQPRKQITKKAIENSATNLVPKGTIIVVTRVALGKLALAPVDLCFSQDSQALLPKNDYVDKLYSLHYLSLATREFQRIGRGTTISGITKKQLKTLDFPLPPLPEQRRIVAKIEELFTQLDAGVAALQRAQAKLKRYKASLLKAACEGRLVATEAQLHPDSYEPAAVLLDRILAERRAQWEAQHPGKPYKEPARPDVDNLPPLPEGWAWATVGQLTNNLDAQRIPVKRSDRAEMKGTFPYYGASGIIDYVDNYIFDGRYLLISEDGANLLARTTPIAFQAAGKFWVNNHAHVVQLYGKMSLDYLEQYMNSFDLRFYVTGTAQPKITQKNLDRIPIAIPPLLEQQRISEIVGGTLSIIMQQTHLVETMLKRINRLRQAILKRAFEGRLVPQDPADPPIDLSSLTAEATS